MPGSSTHSTQSKSSPASIKAPTAKCPSTTAASSPSLMTSPMTSEPGSSEAGGNGEERAELLGSLTTQAHQRTSARVIKKLKLDDQDRERKDTVECELQKLKEFDAEVDKLAALSVKQRTKALWSTDEKSLFFEALNEYGKDFDSITAYICNKMKKKGVSDCNLKTKNQVSHFYYRTWHKLSKYVHFDESVKKVAQELYTLINYGELRRRVPRGSDKWCARVWELASAGVLVLRARGRTLRLRTPPCRALKHLNQISEEGEGVWRVWRVCVCLRARSESAWCRVRAASHNPRLRTLLPPRTKLRDLLTALHRRWTTTTTTTTTNTRRSDDIASDAVEDEDLESELYLPSEQVLTEECKWVLHVAPPGGASPSTATLRPAPLAHRALCYSSYLQRLGAAKIPPTKRQRKDSASEREGDSKRARGTTAGVTSGEEVQPPAADTLGVCREGCEREKGSQSEDDNKSESETETERPLLKVKFRIGPLEGADKWDHSDPCDKPIEEQPKPADEPQVGEGTDSSSKPGEGTDSSSKPDEADKCADESDEKPDVDVEFAIRQIRKGWSAVDAGELTIGDLYLMFGSHSKLELDYWWAEPTPPLPQPMVARQQPSRPISELDKTPPTERDKKPDITPEKEQGDDDIDAFSPKNVFNQDSNDGMSGDERKESGVGVDRGVSLNLASKLLNRPDPPPQPQHMPLTHRLRALLRLAGNPLVSLHTHAEPHSHTHAHEKSPTSESERNVFRHPTPIAPKPSPVGSSSVSSSAWRLTDEGEGGAGGEGGGERGRGGGVGTAGRRAGRGGRRGGVVVQRLLPLSPRDTRTHKLIPVKLEQQLPRLLPKPAPPFAAADAPRNVLLVQERDGQYYCTDANGERRVLTSRVLREATSVKREPKEECQSDVSGGKLSAVEFHGEGEGPGEGGDSEGEDLANNVPEGAVSGESLSLSPGRLLSGAWGDADCSLSSFLAALDEAARHDSPLTSLMAESSIDYVAKFADLAAELEAPSHSDLQPSQSDLQPSHSDLQPSHSDLQPSHSDLQPSHSDLQPSHSDLQPSHSDLQPSHSDLQPSHSDLQPSHSDPQKSHSDLQPSHTDLDPDSELQANLTATTPDLNDANDTVQQQ